MTTTTEPLISAGKGKVKKASCKCHVWKFWATDAICLKQTGWTQFSQVHLQQLLEVVVLSHTTESQSTGMWLSFPWNPKYEWLHRSLQSLCSFLPCTQLNPSTDWDIAGSRDCGDPQGRWGTHWGWSSLPKHKTNLMFYSPSQCPLCTFPSDGCTSSSETTQSETAQGSAAFVNKY